jgi:hypothetical protein
MRFFISCGGAVRGAYSPTSFHRGRRCRRTGGRSVELGCGSRSTLYSDARCADWQDGGESPAGAFSTVNRSRPRNAGESRGTTGARSLTGANGLCWAIRAAWCSRRGSTLRRLRLGTELASCCRRSKLSSLGCAGYGRTWATAAAPCSGSLNTSAGRSPSPTSRAAGFACPREWSRRMSPPLLCCPGGG